MENLPPSLKTHVSAIILNESIHLNRAIKSTKNSQTIESIKKAVRFVNFRPEETVITQGEEMKDEISVILLYMIASKSGKCIVSIKDRLKDAETKI